MGTYTYVCSYKHMNANCLKSLRKDLEGYTPIERGDFWEGSGKEILALPVMFALLDENAVYEN